MTLRAPYGGGFGNKKKVWGLGEENLNKSVPKRTPGGKKVSRKKKIPGENAGKRRM